MNIPVIFQFLKDLSANNNREWFNEHKAEYETARAEFDNFLATVIARISLFDETIRGIQPKDCTYRIYRDTRFSADKTPYKIHFGGYINAGKALPNVAFIFSFIIIYFYCYHLFEKGARPPFLRKAIKYILIS